MSYSIDNERREYQDVDGDNTHRHIEKWITLIQNDDPLIYSQWDNYDPTSSKNLRFPVVPKQSGPKGMSFEKNYITIDSDNDTIDVTQYIQFKNLNRKKVDVSVGGLYLVKLVGSTTESYQRTLEKSKMWLDNSRNTDLIGVRRK